MHYSLYQTEEKNFVYQEIERGIIVRYCDMDGNDINIEGVTLYLISNNPQQPSWARPDREIPQPPIERIISKFAFRNKFTMDEKIVIYTAANSHIEIKIWLDDLAAAENVDLNNSATIQGVESLVQLGLLTEQRKTEILNA